jgi:hypothetical protein
VQVGHLLGTVRNPVYKTYLVVIYACSLRISEATTLRSVPLTGRTRSCGSLEAATSSDCRCRHSRCSIIWAGCHRGSCQINAWQAQARLQKKHPDLIIPDAVWRTRWAPHVTALRAGEQAVLDYVARYVAPIMARFQPKPAVVP